MTAGKSNLPASVAARLLNRAKQTGDVYQTLLTSFCFERFLYRLGQSDVRERFVLKGAMLLRVWSDQPYRATRDLDLLRMGDGSFEAIRAEDEYAGTRATLPARCGTARLSLQIDMVEEPGEENALGRAARGCIESATGTASTEWDNLVTTVGAGYVWKLLGILYLNPWAAAHVVVSGDTEIPVGSSVYGANRLVPEGWRIPSERPRRIGLRPPPSRPRGPRSRRRRSPRTQVDAVGPPQ